MTHIGPLAFSVSANNKVLTVLSATLAQSLGLYCHYKIFSYGDISSGLEMSSNHWGPGQVSTQDVSVLWSHTHIEQPAQLATDELEHCHAKGAVLDSTCFASSA